MQQSKPIFNDGNTDKHQEYVVSRTLRCILGKKHEDSFWVKRNPRTGTLDIWREWEKNEEK